MIPIFDVLAHPTISGKWLGRLNIDASFKKLNIDLKQNGYIGACAVGLDNFEKYNHIKFIEQCLKYKLVGIAGFNSFNENKFSELDQIKKIGFAGIKIHPRISGINIQEQEDDLVKVFNYCNKIGLVIFFCTYSYCNVVDTHINDPYYSLIKILKRTPGVKIVLVHGGAVELLKYMELVRFNKNLLLDLSLTIMKYKGSSIDMDIQYLFEKFDRRICLGTDHPEYSHKEFRKRVESFSLNIEKEKLENIYYKNIQKFLV